MIRKILLPVILMVLAYGFWVSPDFKEIAAGVSIFLFGMISLEEGFKSFTGGVLERLLHRSTDRLWKSLSFGVLTTTLMQSSSLVSVITISFLSAGLIDLAAGIGIIFGANLGTTTGAWLVAGFGLKVKISSYAMPILVFGVILIFQQSRTWKGIGYILAGLGFLFLGIHYMKEGFDSFKDAIDLAAYAMPGLTGLMVFSLLGLIATVIMQSSHATLVLIITALAAQQITYENALALAIGANVGTTITAIIGSMSANIEGKRLAAAHLVFNLTTGLVAILTINQLVIAVDYVSVASGIAEDDYALKLAVFHTIFNLIGVIIMIPFIKYLVNVLNRIFITVPVGIVQPKYLNDAVMEFPETVFEAVRKETQRLYDKAFRIISNGLNLHPDDVLSEQNIDELISRANRVTPIDIDDEYESKVKLLYSEIIAFISRSQLSMPPEFAEQLYDLQRAARNIVEAIKATKHLHKNLSPYITSDNLYIRNEYNSIRIQLAEVLRKTSLLRNEKDVALSMDVLKLKIKKHDSTVNEVIDKMIRDDLISSQMATSLMNDSHYAYDVAHNLIEVGTILYGEHDLTSHSAERTMALDDHDIEELIQEEAE